MDGIYVASARGRGLECLRDGGSAASGADSDPLTGHLAAGVVVWQRRPSNRTGALLCWGGFSMLAAAAEHVRARADDHRVRHQRPADRRRAAPRAGLPLRPLAFEGAWFHSGDVGVMHPDGYVEIRDPRKDIIVARVQKYVLRDKEWPAATSV